MEPGPELDALVAERVMGWKRLEDGIKKMDPKNKVVLYTDDEFGVLPSCYPGPRWSPSTNIAHAWEVVERFGPEWSVEIERWPHRGDKDWACRMVEFFKDKPGIKSQAGELAPTAPHAICLAALKAVEGEDE